MIAGVSWTWWAAFHAVVLVLLIADWLLNRRASRHAQVVAWLVTFALIAAALGFAGWIALAQGHQSALEFVAGYTIEISPAAENWWREAAGVLAHGKLLAIDYGLTAGEIFSPARTGGTLRAYFRHHATDDLLANPGEQDLTAHVNFSAIQKTGEDAGLVTEFFGSQAKFLVEIMAAAEKNSSLGTWTPGRTRQFQTLTHPEHLGRAFRVLVQAR